MLVEVRKRECADRVFIDNVFVGYSDLNEVGVVNLAHIVTDEALAAVRKHFGDAVKIVGPSVLVDAQGSVVKTADILSGEAEFDDGTEDEEDDDDE